ncbi:MAG: hypothetical protein MUF26_01975 [Syntrophales bacterium]|nr:hypothetical protein [Syntrophales bacterium]
MTALSACWVLPSVISRTVSLNISLTAAPTFCENGLTQAKQKEQECPQGE